MAGISDWIKNKKKIYGSLVKKPQSILSLLEELETKADDFHFSSTAETLELRRTLDVHVRIKPEHLWERLITAIMPDLFNQFSFNRSNSIDLVKALNKKEICELIELKVVSDEMSHACFEILFYYLLLLRARGENLIKNDYKLSGKMTLIILAPEYYRKAKYQKEFFAKFKSIVEERYKIIMKFIALPSSDTPEKVKQATQDMRNKIVYGKIANVSQELRDYFLKNL